MVIILDYFDRAVLVSSHCYEGILFCYQRAVA